MPLLSLYLAETNALKLANVGEKLQNASSLNQLAWTVTTELAGWFEWCHPEDTEVRLVLLSPGAAAPGDVRDLLESSPLTS